MATHSGDGRMSLSPAEAGRRVFETAPGRWVTLIGIDTATLRDIVTSAGEETGRRTLLFLDLAGAAATERIVARILDDLAACLLTIWPSWRDAPVSPAAGASPALSASWLKAAGRRAAAGHPPRFRRLHPALAVRQSIQAIDPGGVVLAAGIDPVPAAAPLIQVLEWCASHGAGIAAICAARPPAAPPFDRILQGAIDVLRPIEPIGARLIGPLRAAHPASGTERRVEEALRADAELGPLFAGNVLVATNPLGASPRVDLLWRAGRVVVEIDGPEHRSGVAYGRDRHCDYELLIAGYLVLRLTNEEVETDLRRSIEKIRAVVKFRRSHLPEIFA